MKGGKDGLKGVQGLEGTLTGEERRTYGIANAR
jgi:hypothetical protein